ncbi:unnamed protein product [Lymnaea stagnalis]|uniref:Polypeptide N-acetylgalactosaminyltransferase n=1 Tax=Lymnaea stagnalis TaxID=6523 RepID=A0AAV2I5C0_LYMST
MRIHIRRIFYAVCLGFATLCIFSTVYLFYGRGSLKVKADTLNNILDTYQHAFASPTPSALYWNIDVVKEEFKNMSRSSQENVGTRNEADISAEISVAMTIQYNLDIFKSDQIPINRDVPDSRPQGCSALVYPVKLPTTSVVIPYHNEWPSVILRTVHSLINRTPKHLLKEIILVDDASDAGILKVHLKNYIAEHFPKDLVKLVILDTRQGLIRARLEGLKYVTAEVVSFFDSHMEVNRDWLEPLLNEIVKNKKTIAMGQLDYVHRETFNYNFYPGYRTRYGFRWDMQFFETYFRPDQLTGKLDSDPMPGVLMVGPGFTVDVEYFKSIGEYDGDMKIWGGENIELAWRVWMCGGQLLHVPCSRIGHIERSQPYSFPLGRRETEMHNYKRAVDVWLGDYKVYVYNLFPGMKLLDVGDLSERKAIRDKLQCKDFSWFINNIWPELNPYKEDALKWGQIKSLEGDYCFDNDDYVFQAPKPLKIKPCTGYLKTQGFSLKLDGRLRTTIHCVVAKIDGEGLVAHVENCFLNPNEKWMYNENQQFVHGVYGSCLEMLSQGIVVLSPCNATRVSQKWVFKSEGLLEVNN